MTIELQHLRGLTARLKENLAKCENTPDVDAVHDTRTGTRRVQATVEALLRELPESTGEDAVRAAGEAWLRLLKKIRRTAGPVRDLDVHRKLLEKLVKRGRDFAAAGEIAGGLAEKSGESIAEASKPDIVNAPALTLPQNPAEKRAEDLDGWLKHERQHLATDLQKNATKWMSKLDTRLQVLEAALSEHKGHRRRTRKAAEVALDSFALLVSEIQQLDSITLHDFRKGAKKARYLTETAVEEVDAKLVGGALKKLQDEIGDWHDWLLLAEEAHRALGKRGKELIAMIEAERDRHYVLSMKIAGKLRGRLMGEWQATKSRVRHRTSIR